MNNIDVFLSRPNWVPPGLIRPMEKFYVALRDHGFNPHTVGIEEIPMSSPFDHVVDLMNQCDCSIVLGLPQMKIEKGTLKGNDIGNSFYLPTEWNQIEAAISIMLNKPTLMMIEKGVNARGLFERGAANIFVHEFRAMSDDWIESVNPKLVALRGRVNA